MKIEYRFLDEFLSDKYADGLSKVTIEDYRNHLRRFFVFCGDIGEPELTRQLIRDYRVYLRDDPSINSVSSRTYLRALKVFLHWLYVEGYTETDFSLCFKLPKEEQHVIRVLSDDEIRHLLSMFPDWSFSGVRNRLLVQLMLDSGLRLSEVLNLRFGDISLSSRQILVFGKGFKERVVPISSSTCDLIHLYLRFYLSCFGEFMPSEIFLRCTDGRPLTVSAVKNFFRRLKVSSGIERLHPHLLRHTFATRYIQNGGNQAVLKEILGHTTLKMTSVYLHLSDSTIRENYDNLSPVSQLKKGGYL